MCGGKKKTPPPFVQVRPQANPKAIADNSNSIVPGSKIAAATTQESTFGAELGGPAAAAPVQGGM